MAEGDEADDKGRRGLAAGVRDAYAKIPPRRRRMMLIAAAAVLVALVAVVVFAGSGAAWRPVARGMAPEDMDAATKAFDDKKIPYKLEDGAVLVPAEQIDEARLALAVQTMPSGKSVGFEVFDESSMGRSAFTEKVNLHRALEGELARTIRHIEGVERVRVHLVMPERRVLKELEVPASASVMVELKPGRELSRAQALAIRQLVAGAVEGLQPGQVSIVDQHGRMLTRPDDQGIGSGDGFEREREQETQLEDRVVKLLEPMVGAQKVIARVAIDLDTSRVVETKEDFDPNQQVVRSEREQIDKSADAGSAPSGPPGTASNLPGRNPALNQGGTSSSETGREKSDTIRNYEMDKITTRKDDPLPRVRKLSVAVLVDEASEMKNGVAVPRPRTPEELAQLSRLVSSAVGLDPARGDRIEVTSAPFAPPVGSEAPGEGENPNGPESTEPPLWERPIFWIAAGGAAFVLLLAAIVALARRRKKAAAMPEMAGLTNLGGEAMPAVMASPETPADRRARIAELREKVVALGNEDVHRLAAVFQRWFEDDQPAAVDKKEAA